MSEINSNQLLQDIEDAFSNVEYPGDDNLVYDNSDTYPDVVTDSASGLERKLGNG